MKNRNTYQPILLLIFSTLLLLPFFPGCKKEPLPPPVVEPEELAPTLELTATPSGVIPWGDTLEINVKTLNAKNLWVNDQKQPSALESKIRVGLYTDTIFVFKAKNITLSSEKELEIKVGHWSQSISGLVSSHPWRLDSLRAWRGDTLLASFNLTEDDKKELYYFLPDGRFEWYNKDGKIRGKTVWSFNKDKTQILFGMPPVVKDIEVSEHSLITRTKDTYADGLPCIMECVFMY